MAGNANILPWMALAATLVGGAGALSFQYAGAQRERDAAQDDAQRDRDAAQDALVIKISEASAERDEIQTEKIGLALIMISSNTERIARVEAYAARMQRFESTTEHISKMLDAGHIHTDDRGKR